MKNRDSKKSHKFPNISRIITDPKLTLILTISTVLAGLIVLGQNVWIDYQKKVSMEKERNKIIQEIMFWQGVANKYSNYRDAYFTLAVLYYQLGDIHNTTMYLKKSLDLDPNYEPARQLEKKLQ